MRIQRRITVQLKKTVGLSEKANASIDLSEVDRMLVDKKPTHNRLFNKTVRLSCNKQALSSDSDIPFEFDPHQVKSDREENPSITLSLFYFLFTRRTGRDAST